MVPAGGQWVKWPCASRQRCVAACAVVDVVPWAATGAAIGSVSATVAASIRNFFMAFPLPWRGAEDSDRGGEASELSSRMTALQKTKFAEARPSSPGHDDMIVDLERKPIAGLRETAGRRHICRARLRTPAGVIMNDDQARRGEIVYWSDTRDRSEGVEFVADWLLASRACRSQLLAEALCAAVLGKLPDDLVDRLVSGIESLLASSEIVRADVDVFTLLLRLHWWSRGASAS